VCAEECEVQAIRKNGEINPNECHYCLDCQVTYWNEYKCPPMVDRRKRRAKAGRARELVRGMEETLGSAGLEDIPIRVEPAGREPGPKR
jgi:NosR/NirI family nitrous oxide reductase transcriptional regulator